MALRHYANAPATTLNGGINNSVTVIALTSITGWPVSFPFTVIVDRGTATEEVMEATSSAGGNSYNVSRGIDSTTAFSHSTGALIECGISARDPRESNLHVNSSSGQHGLSGSVVGTTDTQTLTNKDLSSGTNTFPSTIVTETSTDTLTNKTISADNNTINGFAASSFLVSDGTGKADGSAAQKVIPAGAVVGTSDSQTLTNKTIGAAQVNGMTASRFVTSGAGGALDTTLTKAIPSGVVVGDTDTQTLTNKTLKEVTVTNDATTDKPMVVNAITSTSVDLTQFQVNSVTQGAIGPDGRYKGYNVTGSSSRGLKPYAMMAKTGLQGITTGTETLVNFNTNLFDTDSMINLTNETITVPIGGVYRVTGMLSWAAIPASGYRQMFVQVNSVNVRKINDESFPNASITLSQVIATYLVLAQNDVVRMRCQHNRGSDLNIDAGSDQEYAAELSVEWVGYVS